MHEPTRKAPIDMHENGGMQHWPPPRPPRWPPSQPPPPFPAQAPGFRPPPPPGLPVWGSLQAPPPRFHPPLHIQRALSLPCPPRPPPFYFRPPLPPQTGFPRVLAPLSYSLSVVDTETAWLESFKHRHCGSSRSQHDARTHNEPPLRLLRHRVAQAQVLVQRLQNAVKEVVVIDKRLEKLANYSNGSLSSEADATERVEVSRLRVQRERKLATCEALKRELDAANAASGLFPAQQLAEIRTFAARVQKKKAYRKRAKQRRRAEASIRRAIGPHLVDKQLGPLPEKEGEETHKSESDDRVSKTDQQHTEGQTARPTRLLGVSSQEPEQQHQISPRPSPRELSAAPTPRSRRVTEEDRLNPETLTIDEFIAVRRAWDCHIAPTKTPGASTIPPHFVPPPVAPTAQWAAYLLDQPVTAFSSYINTPEHGTTRHQKAQ